MCRVNRKTETNWSQNDHLKLVIENNFERPLANYKQDEFGELIQNFATLLAQSFQKKITINFKKLVNNVRNLFT